MPSRIAIGSTVAAEVALDANVIVGILYDGDVHHERAKQLQNELKRDGRDVGRESERLAPEVLDVVIESNGVLNFNDALVVLLKRDGTIDSFATFDAGFDVVPGFGRLS